MSVRPLWRLVSDGAELVVRATPGASRDAVEGVGEDAAGQKHVKVRVKAVAEKGRANAAIAAVIANWLGVTKSAVSVETGSTSRLKVVRISGDASIAKRLGELTGERHG